MQYIKKEIARQDAKSITEVAKILNKMIFSLRPLRSILCVLAVKNITQKLIFSLLFLLAACAQPISPTGGPRDETPPEVEKTFPESQALNFDGNEVRIIFSEAVRAPAFDKEIFISPLVKRPKIIRSDNAKRIRIKFAEELRPQTTYIITLTDIQDNQEGNKMEEAFILAFSTGDQLDSMEIAGKILSPLIGQGEKEMMVLLFDADSIVNNDILRKRPAYVTKTNDRGEFEFKYLRNSPYKVFGLSDADKSNTYSQPTEKIALSEDSVITFVLDTIQADILKPDSLLIDSLSTDSLAIDSLSADSLGMDSTLVDSLELDSTLIDSLVLDSTMADSLVLDSLSTDSLALDSTLADSLVLDSISVDSLMSDSLMTDSLAIDKDSTKKNPVTTTVLYSFLPDNGNPRLNNYVWIGQKTVAVKFNENLKLDSMQAFLTDTLYQDTIAVTDYSFYNENDPEILFHMERPESSFSFLHLSHVMDSLNNRLDSVLLVRPNRGREIENPILKKPELLIEQEAWKFLTYRILEDKDSSMVYVTDTARVDSLQKRIPISWERKGFEVFLKPTIKLEPNSPYVLRVNGGFFTEIDSTVGDSIYRYSLKWFDPESFGTLSGSVLYDSTYSGPIVLQLIDEKKAIARTVQDTSFAFTKLPEGNYTFRIILDADSNGVWTPGQLYPPRLPEKIYVDSSPVKIKANWDFEKHKVQIGKAPPPPPPVEETEEDESQTSTQGIPNTRPGLPGGRRP